MELTYYLRCLGQILFAGFFIYNGINHLAKKGTISYAAAMGVPYPKLAVYGSGLLLILGGLGVLFQVYVVASLWLLVIFLIPTTFIMHAFWKVSDPSMQAMQRVQFTKNLALLGAVLWMMY